VSAAAQLFRQIRSTNFVFWRNPASAFFTFVFPLMFLVIFTTLFGNAETEIPGIEGTISTSTFYVASMATFAVISACYTNIGISIVFSREAGILKRTRGTPLPAWIYLSGRVAHATFVAFLLVVITVAFGALVYEAEIPTGATLFRFVVTMLVGAASFSALALALTAAIPNGDAAPPIVNASILPLLFLSDVFIPLGPDPAAWVDVVGKVFPVRHFTLSMQAAFLGTPFEWTDVLIVAAWGVGGLVLAARFFTWEPRR
jgi:ABC-2 type transport system permease protein